MRELIPWTLLGLGWALIAVVMVALWLVQPRTRNDFFRGTPRPDPQETGR